MLLMDSPSVSSLTRIIAQFVFGKCRHIATKATAAISVVHAGVVLGTACSSDRHTCCQSSSNDEEEGEMHDLCEVIQVLQSGR